MANKKELTEQEKIQEILSKTSVSFDPKKAEEMIALNTRCKRCGKTLSSLERITFENKCYDCMVFEAKHKRDVFVKKYIFIAFAYILAIVLGGYCANSNSKIWRAVGVAFSGVMIACSLGYVFYTNMDKILPSASIKTQTWTVFGLVLGIDLIICVLTYISNSWILYIVLMLAVACYMAYLAYRELGDIKQNANLIDVYKRKSLDNDYVESITEAIEKRTEQEKLEDIEEQKELEKIEKLNNDTINNKVFDIEKIVNNDSKIINDKVVDTEQENNETVEKDDNSTIKNEPEDSGEFYI